MTLGGSSLALTLLIGLSTPDADADPRVDTAAGSDAPVALCERTCSFRHLPQGQIECCGDLRSAGPLPLEGEALHDAEAIAAASDESAALLAAKTFYRDATRRASRACRSRTPDAGRRCEAILDEALALRLPPSIDPHPDAEAQRELLRIRGGQLLLNHALHVRRNTPRTALRKHQVPDAIRGLLGLAADYERAARWDLEDATRHRLDAATALHDAFMLALQIHRPQLACPTLLAADLTSPELAFDLTICRGETDDRPALRETLDRMPHALRRDVSLWSRHLRLGHPLQSAAIATAALSVGAATSAIFFNNRYLALCRRTTDELRCVGQEPPTATAARHASVAFGIAAPALLLTSGYLYLLRYRQKRARRQGRCTPALAGTPSTAAAHLTCRF